MSNDRIKVKKMPLQETTLDGPYWATVDGENVGENGRCHWQTESDAYACGARYLMRVLNENKDGKHEQR